VGSHKDPAPQIRRILKIAFLLLAAAAPTGAASSARGSEEAWQLLGRGGLVVLIRHALAPGIGDPPNFSLEDCTTQRNLSEAGRRQARAIGEGFRLRGVPIERVHSSRWCRCRETAALAFGAYKEHPALNSFFNRPEIKPAKVHAMKALLNEHRPGAGNLILVTHQVNITALTHIVPASGEMIVVRIGDQDEIIVQGRIPVNE
jgi:phosphohistidine phosphatase SixA